MCRLPTAAAPSPASPPPPDTVNCSGRHRKCALEAQLENARLALTARFGVMAEFCGPEDDYTNYLLRKYGGGGQQQVSRPRARAMEWLVCWVSHCNQTGRPPSGQWLQDEEGSERSYATTSVSLGGGVAGRCGGGVRRRRYCGVIPPLRSSARAGFSQGTFSQFNNPEFPLSVLQVATRERRMPTAPPPRALTAAQRLSRNRAAKRAASDVTLHSHLSTLYHMNRRIYEMYSKSGLGQHQQQGGATSSASSASASRASR